MNQRARILDLDNCISNDGWRIPRIRWDAPTPFLRYHDYQLLSPWDKIGNTDLFKGYPGQLVIFTSRPVLYRASTVEWLERHRIKAHLIMRNDNDHRSSMHVKETQLTQLWNYGIDLSDVDCAYDDRPEICAMYREHGMIAEVRSLHSVCAYINPKTGHNHANGQAKTA